MTRFFVLPIIDGVQVVLSLCSHSGFPAKELWTIEIFQEVGPRQAPLLAADSLVILAIMRSSSQFLLRQLLISLHMLQKARDLSLEEVTWRAGRRRRQASVRLAPIA